MSAWIRGPGRRAAGLAVGAWMCAAPATTTGTELEKVQQLFLSGNYSEAVTQARTALAEGEYADGWCLVLAESLMETGQYTDALGVVSNAIRRLSRSIQVRLVGHRVYQFHARPEQAREMIYQINYLAQNRMWAYRDAPNLIALGQAALILGADERRVLEQFFDVAKARDPSLREVYLAPGELALRKGDYQLAAQIYQEGIKTLPEDPDLHFGLARAFAPSDRRHMLTALDTALNLNTNHVPSHLLLADHLIDGEDYEAAEEVLAKALAVNPSHPEAWAYRALMAHLQGESDEERRHRDRALNFFTNNPAVDHLIGRKLSQKYRFREGAAYQRLALGYDPDYLPAQIQLAQDLLRLGQEEEGWRLATHVHETDGYDVTAYNLVNLKEVLDGFAVLSNESFVLRMSRHEADLYGARALELLQTAKNTLCEKYGLALDQPTVVEVFPDQKDFGVRTFGMPDNPGFLGVCFGPVITANSPASRGGSPNNWEAVLWHEFCHVVTLHITRNKMPRWLSEGISVFEERQRNPAWGQIMNPRYREMVLGDDLTPVGQLSAAFLAPASDLHLQFAYYQSYLVVEFIVKRFGLDALRRVLADLGEGVEINTAISRQTAPIEEIETEFETFARDLARSLGPGLEWDRPEPEELEEADPEWLEIHAENYYVLMDQARRFLEAKDWEKAKEPLRTVLEHYPDQRGLNSAYALLAAAHRALQETNDERAVLIKLAIQDADALAAYARLMELDQAEGAWDSVMKNADRYLAVNPLVAPPYRFLAEAADALDQKPAAMVAYENLLRLDIADPALVHFRLAQLYHPHEGPRARRHLLQALEEAPRYRDAHRLLLELVEPAPEPAAPRPNEPAVPPTPPPSHVPLP